MGKPSGLEIEPRQPCVARPGVLFPAGLPSDWAGGEIPRRLPAPKVGAVIAAIWRRLGGSGHPQWPKGAVGRAMACPCAGHGVIAIVSYPAPGTWIGVPGVLVAVLIGVTVDPVVA